MAKTSRPTHSRWFLREWRKHRGYTQDRLGEMVGLSKPHISLLERGGRQYTQELLERFAEALQCSPAGLIMRDPTDGDAVWSIYETLSPPQRKQATALLRVIQGGKTGTDE